MKKKYDLYLASPLFCDEDNKQLDLLEDYLENKLGLTIFTPRRDSKVDFSKADTKEKKDACAKEILELNETAILQSRIVFANTKGIWHDNAVYCDQGTNYEMGFAVGKGIPLVSFSCVEHGINIMIGQTIVCHINELYKYPEKMDVIAHIIKDEETMTPEQLRSKYYQIIENQV